MAKLTISTDYGRAKEVFGAIYKAYENGSFPFHNVSLPQRKENIPEGMVWGSKEHAIFLFNSCHYMRGRIDSEAAFKGLKKVYEKAPDLFDVSVHSFADKDRLAPVLEQNLFRNGLGFNATQIAGHWIENNRKLALHWGGDPRNIFKGINSFEGAVEKLKNRGNWKSENPNGFYGFREKMVSMLIYFYAHAGIIELFKFPPPIDFHVSRILLSNLIVVVKEYVPGIRFTREEMSDIGIGVMRKWIYEEDKDPVVFSNALWLLSRDVCDKAPGNYSRVPKVRNSRNTEVTAVTYGMTESRYKTYTRRGCSRCPLRETCELSIPSAPYYINGVLELRGERPKFDAQNTLDL